MDIESYPSEAAARHPWQNSDCRVAVGLAVLLFAMSYFFGSLDKLAVPFLHQHLGAEYYNIGRALADGRGFSDPFAESTGPTAWMPPLFPLLIAALLRSTGSKLVTAQICLFLANVSMVFVGTVIYSIGRRCRRHISALFGVAVYIIWIAVFRYWFFLLTQDIWITSTAVAWLVILVYRRALVGGKDQLSWDFLVDCARPRAPR